MKKNVCKILLLSIIFINIVGCNKSNLSNEYKEQENLSFAKWATEKIYFGQKEPYKINCPELNENSIINGSNEIFISNNNVYAYNIEKLYSNNMNCKKVGEIKNNKFISVFNENVIDEKGNFYNNYSKENKDDQYLLNTHLDGWKEYFKRFDINTNMITTNNDLSSLYYPFLIELLTYTDKGLYAYYINQNDGESLIYKININNINEEKILNLYGPIVKTDKAFYTIKKEAINKEICEKYVDVECEYEYVLKKEDILTQYYDEIMNISKGYFITYDYECISILDYFTRM